MDIGGGGFDVAAGPAEDIRLPGSVEIQIECICGLAPTKGRIATGGFAALTPGGGSAASHLREEISAGDHACGFGLGHAAGGDFKILVGVEGAADEGVKFAIVEFFPPKGDVPGAGGIRSGGGEG